MNFLFVTHLEPYPPGGGFAQRTDLLIRSLQRLGEVHLFLLNKLNLLSDSDIADLSERFNVVGVARIPMRGEQSALRNIRPFAPRLVDKIAHNLGSTRDTMQPIPEIQSAIRSLAEEHQYTAVICRHQTAAFVSAPWQHSPTIVDADDYSVQVYQQRLSYPDNNLLEKIIYRKHLSDHRRLVPGILANADHLWVCSEEDREFIGHKSSSVLVNIPYQPEEHEPAASAGTGNPQCDDRMLIVATLAGAPNVKGIDFFVDQVFPLIREKCPSAQVDIVGRRADPANARRWSAIDDVNVVGFVDSVDDSYEKCSFTVIPMLFGGGTRIKVLESLLYQRTCVATEASMRGYLHVLKNEDSVMVAETAEEMADHCVFLIENAHIRDQLAERGKNLVEENYSLQVFAEQVERTIDQLVQRD